MNNNIIFAGAVLALVVGSASSASAQEVAYISNDVPAPDNAFELTLGVGYTRGFGGLRSGVKRVADVAGDGIGVDLGIGYRTAPHFSIGLNGQYQEFNPGGMLEGGRARGVATGINATVHFNPYGRVDPGLLLGVGYRFIWEMPGAPGHTVMTHGPELAKLALYLDIRCSPGVSLGPIVGADLNWLLWRKEDGGANTAVTDPRLNTFLFAGLLGRFDMGGQRVVRAVVSENR